MSEKLGLGEHNNPRREDWVIVIERAAGFGDSPFR
jgi:hypothetical protein